MQQTSLIFVTDIAELVYLKTHEPSVLREGTIVTNDLVVSATAEAEGLRFVSEWSLLEAADVERNDDLVHTLVDRWWDERRASTVCSGVCMAEAISTEFVWPFTLALNAQTVYERLLKAVPCQTVVVFDRPKVGIFRTGPVPTMLAFASIQDAVLRWSAQKAGVPLSIKAPVGGLSERRRLSNRPRFTAPPQGPRRPWDPDRKTALMVAGHLHPQEGWQLEKALCADGCWQVVHLRQWPVEDDPQALALLTAAWEKFQEDAREYAGPYPVIFGNPHLLFQFKLLFTGMVSASRIANGFATLLDTLMPDVVVFGHEAFGIERSMVRVAERRGIPTVGLIHGGLGAVYTARKIVGDARRVLTWNTTEQALLIADGVSAGRIGIIGSLRDQERYQKYQAKPPVRELGLIESHRRKLGLRSSQPLVTILSAVASNGFASVCANMERHRKDWKDFAALVRRHPEITFAIKPHPTFDSYDFYRYLCREGLPNLLHLEDSDLDEVLQASDVAILFNYVTTAAIDAYFHQVPVVYLNSAVLPVPSREPVTSAGMMTVSSLGELEATITRLLTDAAFRDRCVSALPTVLKSLLWREPHPPAEWARKECDALALTAKPRDGAEDVSALADAARMLLDQDDAGFLAAWQTLIQGLPAGDAQAELQKRRYMSAATKLIQMLRPEPQRAAMLIQSLQNLRVDLGCGDHKPDGFVGVDIVAGPCVDIVADLTQRFPFDDSSVDYLRAHDAIEHWPDRLHTMNEIWRVCKPGAVVDIRVPSTDGRGAFQDPTHISYWNSNSFYYYSIDHPPYLNLCRKYGFKGGFKVRAQNVQESDNVVHVHVEMRAVKEIAGSSLSEGNLTQQQQALKEQTVRNLEQAVLADPGNRQSWNNLAKFCEKHGMLCEAAAFATDLAAQRPRELGVLLAAAGLNQLVGDAASARRHYERVLEIDPSHVEARRYLAAAAPVTLSASTAAPVSVEMDPSAWHASALKLAQAGQVEQARDSLRNLAAKHPGYHVALNDLGVLCFQMGRPDEAIEYLERATKLAPTHVNTLKNLLDVYVALKRDMDAARVCRRVLALDPMDTETRGILARIQPKPGTASASLEGMPAAPESPAHATRAVGAEKAIEDSSGAPPNTASLRAVRDAFTKRWLELKPNELQARYEAGMGREYKELLAAGVQDLPLTSCDANELGTLAAKLRQPLSKPNVLQSRLAALLYRQPHLLDFEPDFRHVPPWLTKDYPAVLFSAPPLFLQVGEVEKYTTYLSKALESVHRGIRKSPNAPFWRGIALCSADSCCLLPAYFSNRNLKTLYQQRGEILEFAARNQGVKLDYAFGPRPSGRPVRVGILAYGYYPCAETFAALPVYERLGAGFEVFLYATHEFHHRLEDYCRRHSAKLSILNEPVSASAEQIRRDDLDILFFASNVTAVRNAITMLSLFRLARIHVAGPGSVTTTGMRHMDYYVSGEFTDPSLEAQAHYTEKLVKLPGSAHCFSYGSEIDTGTVRVTRAALGFSDSDVLLVTPANMFKLIPELLHTYVRILKQTKGTRLMLLPFGPHWTNDYPKSVFGAQVKEILDQYGLEHGRVVMVDQPQLNRDDVREFMKLADVCLDSFPFSCSTSLIEPLEAGVPVVTRQGEFFRSAMGAGLMRELGMPEAIAASEEAFVELACRLASDEALRKAMRAKVRERMSAVPRFLNAAAFGAAMGSVFKGLMQEKGLMG